MTQDGRSRIVAAALHAVRSTGNFAELENDIDRIEKSSNVPPSERAALLISNWEASVTRILEDGILETLEEERLVEFKERFALDEAELDKNGALTRIAKAAVLRDLLQGVVPARVAIDGALPINIQKSEQLVWAFSNAPYFEEQTRREFVGSSRGFSVRVMKGVYHRAGAFKGQVVEGTERVHVDTGWVAFTTKHIYVAGPRKSLRVPYSKIVSFQPFSDGIGIMRDATTAKPQIFMTGDGWFTYNLATNLARL